MVDFTVKDMKVGDADSEKSFGILTPLYDNPRAAACNAQIDCTL